MVAGGKNMKFTEFGEYFRILRIKHKEVLKDASEFLDVSCAFISSVELGKKAIPEEWYDKLVAHYALNNKEKRELREAIDRSQKNVKINIEYVTTIQKDLAVQFQRSFDDLDDETANEIIKILKRNS